MRRRCLLAAGAVLACAAGCATPVLPPPPPPPPPAALADLDPCVLLREDELLARGAWPPGFPNRNVPAEPGCDFDGDPFGYSFFTNREMTVAAYGAQDTWARFERRELDGRPAAIAINASSAGGRICSTMFDAGGGVIIVTAGELNDEGRDECADAWQVAELIAPRMPR